MAFTSKFGLAASKPGNMKLGLGITGGGGGGGGGGTSNTFTSKLETHRSRLGSIKLAAVLSSNNTVNFITSNTIAFSPALRMPRSVSNTLVMTQSIHLTFPKSVAHTLVLSQSVSETRIITRSVSNTLALSQATAKQKIANRTVVTSLSLSQVLSRQVSFRRSANNVLSFTQQFRTVAGQSVALPTAQVAVVPKRCMVVLQAGGYYITLPCPNLGDTLVYTGGRLLLKNAITGSQYTYIRRTSNKTLKYNFSMIRAKALELQLFLAANIQRVMQMMNWKGETWLVIVSNNPVEMIAKSKWDPCRERIDVTLEFEGIKIAG